MGTAAAVRPTVVGTGVARKAEDNARRERNTWADTLHDAEARQAYELALVDMACPSACVRVCSGDADEACELIFDFLCREPEAEEEEEEQEADEYDDLLSLAPTNKEGVAQGA